MNISTNGIELIKKFEGCRLEAYKDPAGIYTIGYGHTKGVAAGQKITKQRAEELLMEDIKASEAKVRQYDYKYKWTQNEYDALVSFCYNIGSITALTKFGLRSKKQIAEKMLLYVKAGGKVLKGLQNRRKAEAELFTTPEDYEVTYKSGKQYEIVVSGLVVRKEPSIEAAKAQKTALKRGSIVTCESVYQDHDGNIWIKHKKGFSAALYNGYTYMKEV